MSSLHRILPSGECSGIAAAKSTATATATATAAAAASTATAAATTAIMISIAAFSRLPAAIEDTLATSGPKTTIRKEWLRLESSPRLGPGKER